LSRGRPTRRYQIATRCSKTIFQQATEDYICRCHLLPSNSRPQLSDLRDSGAIEQDAEIVLFVHREEVENPQSHLKGFADVFAAKNRQGKVDDVVLEYEGQFTRFVTTRRPRPVEHVTALHRGFPRGN
jgi:replicative DNA helicase